MVTDLALHAALKCCTTVNSGPQPMKIKPAGKPGVPVTLAAGSQTPVQTSAGS
jgi:hypothetical protein